jgi:hypothetical protein
MQEAVELSGNRAVMARIYCSLSQQARVLVQMRYPAVILALEREIGLRQEGELVMESHP